MKHRASLLMSALALVVSLTAGGAYASTIIVDGSLIKNHTIGVAKLTPQAVKQLKGAKGSRGFRGADGIDGQNGTGFAGPAGAAGAPGAPGGFNPAKVQYLQGPTTTIFPGQTLAIVANCPAGSIAISGGYFSGVMDVGAEVAQPNGYGVVMQDNTGISGDVFAFAVCAAP